MIDTVLFDFGGVVVAPREDVFYADAASILNTTPGFIMSVVKPYISSLQRGALTEDVFITRLTNSCGMPAHLMKDQITTIYKEHFEPYATVIEFIQTLAARDVATAVVSNTIPSHVKVMRESGLLDMFDVVVLSCEVGMRKPSPEIFAHTLKRLDRTASRAVFIDDLTVNTRAAEALGIRTILAIDPDQIVDDLHAVIGT